VGEDTAVTGLASLATLIDERYPHSGWLAHAAWELRHTVTFYHGLYVALAARLDVPLLTSDANLGAAPELPCRVDLIA
jgi:predicted nucleic acid-binding protein